jgi:probable addiction module antidote protein
MADSTTLDTLEALSAFLADAFETGDPDHIAAALSAATRAPAFPALAAAAGLPRDALTQSLASGELSLDTTLAIMKVIDLHLPPRPGAGMAS